MYGFPGGDKRRFFEENDFHGALFLHENEPVASPFNGDGADCCLFQRDDGFEWMHRCAVGIEKRGKDEPVIGEG